MADLTEADFAFWDEAGGDLTPVWDRVTPAQVEKIVGWARSNFDQWVQIKTERSRLGTINYDTKVLLESGDTDGALTKVREA
jgi:hypothetical protein